MKNPERKLVKVSVSDIGHGFGPPEPLPTINWPLKKNDTFDEITGDSLSAAMLQLGLDGPNTTPLNAQTYIDNVQKQMTPGTAVAVIVGQQGTINEAGEFVRSVGDAKPDGEVTVSDPVQTQYQLVSDHNTDHVALLDIVDPTHFDWLQTTNLPPELQPFA